MPTLSPVEVCAPAMASIVQAAETGFSFVYYETDQSAIVADPAAIATSGEYYITKKNETTGCVSDFSPITVAVNALPDVIISQNHTQFTCDTTTIILTATAAGVSYQWTDGP